ATTPVAGGETIVSSASGCSTALTGVRGGAAVVITAGHCGFVGTNWSLYANGVDTATVGATAASLSNPVDASAINVNSGQTRNCVVQGNGSCLTVRYSNAQLVQGAAATKSGSTTGETGGTIQSTDSAFNTTSTTVPNGILTSNQADH